MKKYTLLENFKHTDSEIEDFFLDFIDNNANFTITNGFLSTSNRFYTDVALVHDGHKHCKKIELTLDSMANGITCHNTPQALTNINKLSKTVDEIKHFYSLSDEEVNFYIEPKYDDITIGFYVTGPIVEQSSLDTKNEIGSLLTELSGVLKLFNKKPILKTNWLEIRLNNKEESNIWYNMSKKMIKGIPFTHQNDRYIKLDEIVKKIVDSGYKIKTSGGDRQLIFSLYK